MPKRERELSETFSSNKRIKYSISSKDYKSIVNAFKQAKDEKNFEKAFALAQEAKKKCLTVGHMLVSKANYLYAKELIKKSIGNKDTQRRYVYESIINFNLVKLLIPDTDKKITRLLGITEEKIIEFAERCGKKFTFFNDADAEYVLGETKQRFAKIQLESSESNPQDSADTPPGPKIHKY
jgi:hypothetical protein